MRFLLTFFLILIFIYPVMAQAPDTVWTRLYKPAADDYSDKIYGGCVTSDGNFVVTGYCDSYQWWNGQQYLLKINADGDTLWSGNYGTAERDYGWGVVETYDMGLATVGYGRLSSISEDYKIRLFRTDSLGNQLWEKAFAGLNDCNTYGITTTADSGFAIVGYTGPYGNYDMFLMRVDSAGDSLWMKTYGGAENDEARDIVQTDDGGFMLVGHTESYGAGRSDIYIVRTDAAGDTLWTFTYGDTSVDNAFDIMQTSAGDYVVAGYSIFTTATLEQRMLLIRIQDNGDTVWTTSLYAEMTTQAYAVCEANDGGFIMTGKASYGGNTDVGIAKVNADGDSLWMTAYGGAASDEGWFVHQDPDGSIYVAGTHSWNSSGDYYVIKLAGNPLAVDDDNPELLPRQFHLAQNVPNPFNAGTVIEYTLPERSRVQITVFNLLGQRVATLIDDNKPAGTYTAHWDGTDTGGRAVGSGIYFYRMTADDLAETRKMVLLK